MPTYLDMLPDEIYHTIYRPIFVDVIKECVVIYMFEGVSIHKSIPKM